jgi:hypothetical protein
MVADTSNVTQAGDEFTVDILLAKVNNLAGVAFEVSFDPAVLGVVKDADGNSITANPEVFKPAPDNDIKPNPFYRKDTSYSARLDGTTATVYYEGDERKLQPMNVGADPVCLGTIKFKFLSEKQVKTRLEFTLHELVSADADYVPHQVKSLTLLLPPALVEAPVITAPVDKTYSRDTQPVISGTGLPGALLRLYDGNSEIASLTVLPEGNWNVQVGPLTEGLHAFSATQQDAEGKVSLPSNTVRYIVDTVAPQPPVISVPLNGSTVTVLRPEIAGAGEKGATVTACTYNGAEVFGTAVVNRDGRWTLTPDHDLTDGATYRIKASQADRAGNVSGFSEIITFTVNTGAAGGSLAMLVISPERVEVGTGRSVDFVAVGYDANGIIIRDIHPVWEVVYGYGTIDTNGHFVANTPGTETVIASVYGARSYATVDIFGLPRVSLQPSQTVGIGQEFKVNVWVDDVADLTAFNVDIGFDPSYLQVVNLKSGGFLAGGIVVASDYNNESGTISYAEYTLGNPVAGSGSLLEITLRAKKAGSYVWDVPAFDPGQPVQAVGLVDSGSYYMDYNPAGVTVEIVAGGKITGQITFQNSEFTGDNGNITVELWQGDTLKASTTTKTDGSYEFNGISGDGYKIVASHFGYLTREQGDISVAAGKEVIASFKLLFGEFTDNGVSIDIRDINVLARKYRQTPTDPVYDYNRNNLIDIADINAVARNYRKAYPPGY